MRALLIGVMATSIAVLPQSAQAGPKDGPTQITPQKKSGKERRRARRADVDRSEGGRRQGVVELTLGSIVLGSSALLVGRGIWELVGAERAAEACAAGSGAIECQPPFNPRRGGSIAAGLSFATAGVMGLAGGFLLARGIRIRRDYLEWKRVDARLSLRPWATVQRPAGGLTLHVRF